MYMSNRVSDLQRRYNEVYPPYGEAVAIARAATGETTDAECIEALDTLLAVYPVLHDIEEEIIREFNDYLKRVSFNPRFHDAAEAMARAVDVALQFPDLRRSYLNACARF